MRRAIIAPDGTLALGDQAERLGFRPGVVVEVFPSSSAGVLFVVLDDSPPAIDARYRPLVGGAAQLALRRAQKGI